MYLEEGFGQDGSYLARMKEVFLHPVALKISNFKVAQKLGTVK